MRPGSYHYIRRSHFLFHAAAYLGGTVILFLVLRTLAPVLTPIFTALAVAYLLDPLVDALERRGVGRLPAVVMIMLTFAMLVTAAIAILIPLVADDAYRFAHALPRMVENVASWLRANFDADIPRDSRAILDSVAEQLRNLSLGAGGSVVAQTFAAIGGVLRFLGGLLELLLIPVFAFYFLLDFDRIVARVRTLIPPRHRDTALGVAREIDRVVSHWVRGTLTVVAILAVLYPIGLSIARIQLAVPIGILAGLLTLIPYIGTFVGFSLAALMAIVDWQGPERLIAVVIVFVALHVLEAFFLTPRIVGKKVGIGEAGALFAVIAGGELLGFVGVVIAIPIAAAVAVVVRRLLRFYAESDFFTYGSPDAEPIASPPADAPPPPKQGELP